VVIAIDGPAGAGKSTVARVLARRLGFSYLDSGAMYRCVALAALREQHGALPQRLEALAQLAAGLDIRLDAGADGRAKVMLDGCDVSDAIRAPEVSEAASTVAANPGVRKALVAKQRRLLAGGDWVAEGRDIGTVVAPDASVKVFLTAAARERARRRAAELGVGLETVLAGQAIRDRRDSTREHSPLVPAPGAVTIDTTGLGVEEVVERIAGIARSR